MDMQDAMRKAGIVIPERPSSIEKKAQSTRIKINTAYKIVKTIDTYVYKYSNASDEEEQFILRDAIVTKFNELTQFIKDIACIVFNYDTHNRNVKEADEVSLSWAIRQIKSTFDLNKEQQNCLDNFTLRNIAVHDYINSEINKNDIVKFFMGNDRIKALKQLIEITETYCVDNKIV